MAARRANDRTKTGDGATDASPAVATGDTSGRAWLVNHGTGPLVYDGEGRTIAAGARVVVDALDAVGRAAVERGYLSVETWDDGSHGDADPDREGPGESTGD